MDKFFSFWFVKKTRQKTARLKDYLQPFPKRLFESDGCAQSLLGSLEGLNVKERQLQSGRSRFFDGVPVRSGVDYTVN